MRKFLSILFLVTVLFCIGLLSQSITVTPIYPGGGSIVTTNAPSVGLYLATDGINYYWSIVSASNTNLPPYAITNNQSSTANLISTLNVGGVTTFTNDVESKTILRVTGTGGGTGLRVSGRTDISSVNVTNSLRNFGWHQVDGSQTNLVSIYLASGSPLYFINPSGTIDGQINGTSIINTNAYHTNAFIGTLTVSTAFSAPGIVSNLVSAGNTNTTALALVQNGTNSTGKIKTIEAGSNMTITDNVTNLVFASTGGGSITYAAIPSSGIVGGSTVGWTTNLSSDLVIIASNLTSDVHYFIDIHSAGYIASISNYQAYYFRDSGLGGTSSFGTNGSSTLEVWKDGITGRTNAILHSPEFTLVAGWGSAFVTNNLTKTLTVVQTNIPALIATNATSVTVDFSDTANTQIYNAWFHLTTNLVISPTNLVTGRTLKIYFATNSLTYDVTITNTAANSVKWNFNVLTNGLTSFTKTNSLAAMVFLTAETNGVLTAELGYYR